MCSLILPENAIVLKLNSRNLSERFGSTRWFRFFACSLWLTLMVRERILVGSVMTFNARIYLFWKQHQELRRKALWIQRTIPWRVSIALCTCWMSWFESIRMFGFNRQPTWSLFHFNLFATIITLCAIGLDPSNIGKYIHQELRSGRYTHDLWRTVQVAQGSDYDCGSYCPSYKWSCSFFSCGRRSQYGDTITWTSRQCIM